MSELLTIQVDAPVQVRDLAKREVDFRIMPWDRQIDTNSGPELFVRGAFEGTDPSKVKLMDIEHAAHFGLGQDGQPILTRRPIGKGLSIEERDDGAYMTVRVAATAAGDEYLSLASEGVVDGVSIEFDPRIADGTTVEVRNGRRVQIRRKVKLTAISPTYRPAYAEAQVLAVRSEEKHMADKSQREDPAPEPEPEPPSEPQEPDQMQQFRQVGDAEIKQMRALNALPDKFGKFVDDITDRMGKMEERQRSSFSVPAAPDQDQPKATVGQWMSVALRGLSGERLSEADPQYRQVAELVTTDNLGVVPHTHMQELIGVIDRSRPFLATTRRLETPTTGMDIVVPKITLRPTTGVQAAEKDELTSTETTITSETFSAQTIGGVGDISLQLLRRSSPSYLSLYLELLAEAMAIDAEDRALRALFDEIGGGVTGAGALDPNDLQLGGAYQTSFNAVRRPPDTIWLSTEAVGEFIDAQASGTNAPLYSNLQADITAAGGLSGTISGLRAVHVPALDTHDSFAVVGPSSGFAWAEDGAFTLQVDVPSKAGRDVALVSIFWFAPWYPDAFSVYNVAS